MKYATLPLMLASIMATADWGVGADGQLSTNPSARGLRKDSGKGGKGGGKGGMMNKGGKGRKGGKGGKSGKNSKKGKSKGEYIECLDNVIGTVFCASNDRDANELVLYHQQDDGELCGPVARYPTGGVGYVLPGENINGLTNETGAIPSQDSILVGDDWAIVPNPGSSGPDGLTSFRKTEIGWVVTGLGDTGGNNPHAVAKRGDIVYVSNAEGNLFAGPDLDAKEGSFTGFKMSPRGQLIPIPGSTRYSPPNALSTQISFSLDGKFLIIAFVLGQEIRVYGVDKYGVPSEDYVSVPSAAPFAFEQVDINGENYIFVPEFFTGGISSYKLESDGNLTLISQSVKCITDGRPPVAIAMCWIRHSGNYLYGINASAGSISIFEFDEEGVVTCSEPEYTEGTNFGFHDAHVQDGHLYVGTVVNPGKPEGEITSYEINEYDGSLTLVDKVIGPGAAGYGLDGFLYH